MQAIIAGLIRHSLTTLGGSLLTSGVVSGSDVDLLAGALTVVGGVGWSILQKYLAAKVK